MHSPASAIAFELARKHRWGLSALLGYLLVLAAVRLLVLEPAGRVHFDDAQTFAFVVLVPLTSTFMYFLAVFSFGLSGDLAARQSMYPARMFTLPVTTSALAGWPMLYGTVTMAFLWLATRLLAAWPSDVDVPVLWPALLAASLLAWTQALTWMPYALPGLRVLVTVLWLVAIDTVVLLALHFQASEGVMLAILAPHVPLAYLVARFAIARARRGDVPDWRDLFPWAGVRSRERAPFQSAARAQAWYEWRRHGRSLPALVALVLPFELALLLIARETPAIVFYTLTGVLLTPPFLAAFVAATAGKSGDSYGVTPFLATRPMTSASLVAAKLKAAMYSTLVTWLLVIAAVPLALRLAGTAPTVMEWMRDLTGIFGMPRAIAMVLLGLAILAASTWKQLVQSLYIGMSGREWLVKASVFVMLSFLAVAIPLGQWILTKRQWITAFWNALPWIITVLVILKISAAAWIAMRLDDTRLLGERTLLLGALCWNVLVFALYALLVWLLTTLIIRSYIFALLAILAIPLARVAAAPLALAWNRHR